MIIPLRKYVHSVQLRTFGVIGTGFLLCRMILHSYAIIYRDVFFDGNEKMIVRTDEKNPEAPPKKYKVIIW